MNASAYPAIALTLKVNNPTSDAVDASFMLNIPIGGWTDCARADGKNATTTQGTTYAACMHNCAAAGPSVCQSWQFDDAKQVCTHNKDVPPTAHATGMHCGVAPGSGPSAGWTAARDGGLTWSQRPTTTGPSMGDITLHAVTSSSSSGAVTSTTTSSYAVNDDPAVLFEQFASASPRGSGADDNDGIGSSSNDGGRRPEGVDSVAAHGAATVSTTIAANSSSTLTIIFSWYFSDRNYHAGGGPGDGDILGNGYANLWDGSAEVASEMAAAGKLESVVADINSHHAAVAHPLNPTPEWLKDMLVNQFSHFHMLMWYKDGRMREYEAWSCDDVDSVHNDFQRHLMYQWFYPEFERQKIEAWGSWAQSSDGKSS